LAIKEMPLEEKYDRLLDEHYLGLATDYVILKEQGLVDKSLDLWVKVQKKMLPGSLGMAAFKLLKAISPGRAFKQVTDQLVYTMQNELPLSNMEVTYVSDREANVTNKNCPILKRMRDVVEKVDLDVDPKFICEYHTKYLPELLDEFGIEVSCKLEENGCVFTGKLK